VPVRGAAEADGGSVPTPSGCAELAEAGHNQPLKPGRSARHPRLTDSCSAAITPGDPLINKAVWWSRPGDDARSGQPA
jgi:hypothetical protein